MRLYDTIGASEGIGYAFSDVGPGDRPDTARFRIGEQAIVIGDDGSPLAPGAGEPGLLAVRGRIPIAYLHDDEASRRVFRDVDGVRYSVPGDWALLEADGTVTLLGRGSGCITTGGEKVFPEEVEETLKEHPAVADCAVVGTPDDEWGQAIVAVVSLQPERTASEGELREWVGASLAGYKRPRRVVIVDEVRRVTAGKPDYAWAADVARRDAR
jgi:fatty-acyl-CoA synthase